MISIAGLDHLVLTVGDLQRTVAFYRDMLGMEPIRFTGTDGSTRWALKFGQQKINLHEAGQEFEPKAAQATVGSADLCLYSEAPLGEWIAHLGEAILLGPIKRNGATGPLLSIYVRDPDGNLIEISNRL